MMQTMATASPEHWLAELLGQPMPREGEEITVLGHRLVMRDGILRLIGDVSVAQSQTEEGFGYKWTKRETYDSPVALARVREWLISRYGDVAGAPWWNEHGARPLLLDAGCGSAMSALELFDGLFGRMRYVGTDISRAVDVARARFAERGAEGAFLQSDLFALPFKAESFDLIFSEGVLHHTDSTEQALYAMAKLLRPGGRILFYVYRRKGPIREFTDDYVRDKLQKMTPDQAWDALIPLTKLGIMLGELDLQVDVPEAVDLLGIPAGPVNLQRLFYWHIFKAFHAPELSLEETNCINFDWYFPRNAHRQSLAEIREWCASAALIIEREAEEPAGVTVIARKSDRQAFPLADSGSL